MRPKPTDHKHFKPRGQERRHKYYEAEQFRLALEDNMLENLRIKLEHDANIELFLCNSQVVPTYAGRQVDESQEQLELFPLSTGLNNRSLSTQTL